MAPSAEISVTPSGIKVVYYDKSHRYKLGIEGEGLRFVPSITTILDGAIPKKLSGWAERGAVEACQELVARRGYRVEFEHMLPEGVLGVMQNEGLRWWQRRDAAGLRGTTIHKAFERLAEGKRPKLTDAKLTERGYIQGIAKWWLDYQPHVEHAELMVGSWVRGFAGRMDLLGSVNRPELVGPGVIDLKTSKSVYESHHFQTAGYRIGVVESGYGNPSWGAILRVAEDGSYEFVPTWATPEQFIALFHSHQAQREFEAATPPEFKKERKRAA